MTISPIIQIGWTDGPIPRPQHPSWPDVTLVIKACYWDYGKPMSKQQADELRDYLIKFAPVWSDFLLEYHRVCKFQVPCALTF